MDNIHTVLSTKRKTGSNRMQHKETIAAIATSMQQSGIGIIRISGPDADAVAERVFRSKSGKRIQDCKSHTIHYGFIYDGDILIDEVMVMIMRAPNSFTSEDTIEIDCHGGILVMNKILETVIKNGARVAEPGEFTKRAFLNGRIDLTKAEAVMDLIHSKNEFAMKNSIGQIKGTLYTLVKEIRDQLLFEIAYIESALDDPEHISLDGYPKKLSKKLFSLNENLNKLTDSFQIGKMIKEGIRTVIVGKPNVGKSSLLNILVGEERAIVTEIAGTTRDVLEETIMLHGIGLQILDTAGIRETEDTVEKIGVERAIKYAKNADLVLYIVDASIPLDENDEEIIKMIENRETIVLLNKTDLKNVVNEDELKKKINKTIISISAKENKGIDLFEKELKNMFFQKKISYNDEIYITNIRHKEAIEEAKDSIKQVMESIEAQMPEDFYSIDLMNAYTCLGKIIGENVDEDLMNEIFSKFCMGK